MEQTGGTLDEGLLRNLFTSLGGVFDWLCQWAPVDKCFTLAPNPFNGQLGVTTKDQAYGSGKFITTHILPYLEKLGVEVLTETKGTELVLSSDGAVAGIHAKDPGGILEITCSKCLLCTGSLIRSERIRTLIPEFAEAKPKRYAHDMPGLTGDGLTMAERAGIPINTDSIVLAFVGCMPWPLSRPLFRPESGVTAFGSTLRANAGSMKKPTGKPWPSSSCISPRPHPLRSSTAPFWNLRSRPCPRLRRARRSGRWLPLSRRRPDFAVQRGEKRPNTRKAFRDPGHPA